VCRVPCAVCCVLRFHVVLFPLIAVMFVDCCVVAGREGATGEHVANTVLCYFCVINALACRYPPSLFDAGTYVAA
jgi:hypothetical protein